MAVLTIGAMRGSVYCAYRRAGWHTACECGWKRYGFIGPRRAEEALRAHVHEWHEYEGAR